MLACSLCLSNHLLNKPNHHSHDRAKKNSTTPSYDSRLQKTVDKCCCSPTLQTKLYRLYNHQSDRQPCAEYRIATLRSGKAPNVESLEELDPRHSVYIPFSIQNRLRSNELHCQFSLEIPQPRCQSHPASDHQAVDIRSVLRWDESARD